MIGSAITSGFVYDDAGRIALTEAGRTAAASHAMAIRSEATETPPARSAGAAIAG